MFRNCTTKFEKVIMNNSDDGATFQNQINFQSDEDGSWPFGMNLMFHAKSGRLLYARERLGLVFNHWNHFGYHDDGSANDHQSSSFISFDEENAEDARLAWSWSCSHSEIQNMMWDREKFIIGDLGDSVGVSLWRTDVEQLSSEDFSTTHDRRYRLNYKSNCNVEDELIIPGAGTKVAGRIGGLIYLNEDDYVLVYSRRKVTLGSNVPVENSEIGFYRFDKDLKPKGRKIIPVDDGEWNNLLHSARYGNRIAVGSADSHCIINEQFVCEWITFDQPYFLKLYDIDGNNFGSINVKGLPAGDDFEVLADGRVVWVSFDRDGNITYHYLDPPN